VRTVRTQPNREHTRGATEIAYRIPHTHALWTPKRFQARRFATARGLAADFAASQTNGTHTGKMAGKSVAGMEPPPSGVRKGPATGRDNVSTQVAAKVSACPPHTSTMHVRKASGQLPAGRSKQPGPSGPSRLGNEPRCLPITVPSQAATSRAVSPNRCAGSPPTRRCTRRQGGFTARRLSAPARLPIRVGCAARRECTPRPSPRAELPCTGRRRAVAS